MAVAGFKNFNVSKILMTGKSSEQQSQELLSPVINISVMFLIPELARKPKEKIFA